MRVIKKIYFLLRFISYLQNEQYCISIHVIRLPRYINKKSLMSKNKFCFRGAVVGILFHVATIVELLICIIL